QLDIADPDSVEAVIEKIAAEVGDVDVLVNNAGFGLFDNFVDFDLDVAKNMFEVNVLGIMYFTQKIAISMVNNKSCLLYK
ncbi:SDR family NAD(P)-dependent oxidoreductase, partial [Enterococcus sp. S181_ASV_20]|nr:SDR family NAD(P)-dependent oxidoreductase [Enterococcus sp. S181_ASV_20]